MMEDGNGIARKLDDMMGQTTVVVEEEIGWFDAFRARPEGCLFSSSDS